MKILFVVNPVAGGIDKSQFLDRAILHCKNFDVGYEIFKTSGENDEGRLRDELKTTEPEIIASVGGDGTLLLVCKQCINTDIKVGIIPMGSANGMATELDVPTDPDQALKQLLLSETCKGLDLIKVNNDLMLHIGDVGTNAQIVRKYEEDVESGMVIYAKYFLEALKNTRPFKVRIRANRDVTEKRAIMVAICNARRYGTGIPINLISDPTDGKFEIVLFERVNIAALIKAGLAKLNDRFYSNQDSVVISTSEAEIEFDREHLLQLDGEVMDPVDKLSVRILPSVVNILDQSITPA